MLDSGSHPGSLLHRKEELQESGQLVVSNASKLARLVEKDSESKSAERGVAKVAESRQEDEERVRTYGNAGSASRTRHRGREVGMLGKTVPRDTRYRPWLRCDTQRCSLEQLRSTLLAPGAHDEYPFITIHPMPSELLSSNPTHRQLPWSSSTNTLLFSV